ncbi:hypothetical protein [Desulfobacula sp.]|uniref:hypothetical protein n=1 Tax=Desulfobacula sp. TaxID=2593537 RepID=UPI00262A8098|nr:hypothetical protein [Desulfobacula sp.]
MPEKNIKGCILLSLLLCLMSVRLYANDLAPLFERVEALNIQRQGYVLGAVLNPEQLKTASANPMDAAAPDTVKFKDQNLVVVAQKSTHRILILYEEFETLTQPEIQDLIGDLYLQFDDPTVLAHDRVVYWAYGEKGKITAREFDTAGHDKRTLKILATVKCISDINIMEKGKDPSSGHVYYIISSDPILRLFKDKKA